MIVRMAMKQAAERPSRSSRTRIAPPRASLPTSATQQIGTRAPTSPPLRDRRGELGDLAPFLKWAVLAQTANVQRTGAHFAGVYTYDVVSFWPGARASLCAGPRPAPSTVGRGPDAGGPATRRPPRRGRNHDAMWRAAIQAGADRITITSYNEARGTQIELVMTRCCAGHRRSAGLVPVRQPYYEGPSWLHGKRAAGLPGRTAY
jgi:hypothetical protein